MFESGSNLIGLQMQKSRIFDPIQNSTDLKFLGLKIAMFQLGFIMYEGMGLAFNQAHQPLYILDLSIMLGLEYYSVAWSNWEVVGIIVGQSIGELGTQFTGDFAEHVRTLMWLVLIVQIDVGGLKTSFRRIPSL